MTVPRTCLAVSFGAALLLSTTLGYFLLAIPIQTTDSFVNILILDRPFGEVLREGIQGGYVRPGLWGGLKVVYDLSQGSLFYWFRWTQVVQVFLVLVLFVGLVRPRTAAAALAAALALAVLVGHHSFTWTVREAFPINTFLTIVVCCGAAACLAFGAHRWWTDVAAALLFVFASATVETGLIVGGIFLVGYVLGLRGVSRNGVAVIATLIAGYFVFRFGFLDAATPAIDEREAGFGFRRYDGAEVEAMFAGRKVVFYAYNVAVSIVGTLLAEPRDGVWRLTRSIVSGAPDLPLLVGVVASTLATALIARYIWVRRSAWRRFDLDRDDRIVVMFLLVLAGNAAISFAYTKDVIMSPAGFFFAAAFFVACRYHIASWTGRLATPASSRTAHRFAVAFTLVLSVGWSVRLVGLHASLTHTAFKVREQWAYVDEFIGRRYQPVPPHVKALKTQLQNDAVTLHPQRPQLREALTPLFEMD
jgi:hypothetical protein